MKTTRRTFLRKTMGGVFFLSAAKILPGTPAWALPNITIPASLRFFSPDEYLLMRTIAERMTGHEQNDNDKAVDIALRADEFLSTAEQDVQEDLHLLLSLFDSAIVAFLVDFRFSSFMNMRPEDQDSYIDDWMTSVIEFRRTAFQALKRLAMSMYYTDNRSWSEIGYEGMLAPEKHK